LSKKKDGVKDELIRVLEQSIPELADYSVLDGLNYEQRKTLTKLDVFYMRLVEKALHGDMKAIQEILDRVYGKAPQTIHQKTENHSYVHYLEDIRAEELKNPTPPLIMDAEIKEKTDDEFREDLGL